MSPSSRSNALLSASVPPLRQTTQSTRPSERRAEAHACGGAGEPDREQVADRSVRRHDRPFGRTEVQQVVEPPAEEAVARLAGRAHQRRARGARPRGGARGASGQDRSLRSRW